MSGFRWVTHDREHICYCCRRNANMFRALHKIEQGCCCDRGTCTAGTIDVLVTCDIGATEHAM